MTLEHRTYEVGGLRLSAVESGAGDPAYVLVHGLGSSVLKWRDLVPHLGARGRALAVNLPGFDPEPPARPVRYTIGSHAGAVRASMDAAGVERAVLVGNSLGGLVAMWLAAAWPERVSALVLIGPALPSAPGAQRIDLDTFLRFVAPLVPGAGEAAALAYMRRLTPEQIVEDSLTRNCGDPTRVSRETFELLCAEAAVRRTSLAYCRALLATQRSLMWTITARRERVARVAEGLQVPTLLLWGEHDRLVPAAVGEHWVSRIPGAELIVLEGAGHNPQMEVPDRVAEVIAGFAERRASGAAGVFA